MKHLSISLGLVMICATVVLAQCPQIEYVIEPRILQEQIDQPLMLWIDATGPWSLSATAPVGLLFADQGGAVTTGGVLSSGMGDHHSAHELRVFFQPYALELGEQELKLGLNLEGAQGILGLPLSEHNWIMPLNNEAVWVLREGNEKLIVASGQWTRLEDGDRLFFGDEEVMLFQTSLQPLKLTKKSVERAELWWDQPSINLQAGDEVEVKLNLVGPKAAGTLVLENADYAKLGVSWSLDGNSLEARSTTNQCLVLDLPRLPPGVHGLQGKVTALLPPTARKAVVMARWQGSEALLDIALDRNWFDYGSQQSVQVHSPGGSTSLIMTDGRIRSVRGKIPLTVPAEGLNLLLPLANLQDPIWLGLPLAESILWSLEPSSQRKSTSEFFVPILLWDQGFSWRLIAGTPWWFFDSTTQRQVFQGQFGPLHITSSASGFSFSTVSRAIRGQGNWHWQETLDARQGIWRQGAWRVKLEIPRKNGQTPQLEACYRAEDWQVQIAPKDVVLRLYGDGWTLGSRLRSRTLWLDLEQGLRFSLDPHKLQVSNQIDENTEMRLQVQNRQNYQVQFTYGFNEAYLQFVNGEAQLGVRFKHPKAKGRWLFLTKGAAEYKNNLLLLELGQEMGYVLTPWCTLYVQAALGTTMRRPDISKLDLSYGAGAVITPCSQFVASLGWHSETGWQCKAGVVIPFVGRETAVDYE